MQTDVSMHRPLLQLAYHDGMQPHYCGYTDRQQCLLGMDEAQRHIDVDIKGGLHNC